MDAVFVLGGSWQGSPRCMSRSRSASICAFGSPPNAWLGPVGCCGSEKSQNDGMRVPSSSAFGFFSHARTQSGLNLDFARRKLGAAEAGSWFGASFPITWQEVHFNSAISAVASFDLAGLISCDTGVRYGQLFCDAAAKKWTR